DQSELLGGSPARRRTGAQANQTLEAAGAVRRSEAGWAVVAGAGGAEVAARVVPLPTTAMAVRAARHVEERAGRRGVREAGRVVDRAGIPGQPVDRGDDRRRHARAAEDVPVGTSARAVAVVDRDAGARIGDCRDV